MGHATDRLSRERPVAERAILLSPSAVAGQAGDRDRGEGWSALSQFPRSTGGRMLRGVLWNTAGSALAQGGSFLTSIVLARIFGRHLYGEFALIQSTVIAVTCVGGLGLGVTATKYVSEYRTTDPERVGEILGLSALVALAAALFFAMALVGFAPWLAIGKDETGILTLGLRLSAVYVFFIILNAYQIGALAGFEAFRSIAKISGVSALASLLLSWALAIRLGLCGAVVAQGAGTVLLWLLYQRAVRSECRDRNIQVRYLGAWRERSVLFRFSVPAAASGMIASVAMWWCNANLARVSGYPELAVFSAVNSMRSMVLFLPALITRVASPVLNSLLAGGDVGGYRRVFWGTVAANGGIALFLAAALSLAGQQILRLFGKDFAGSPSVVYLLLGSAVVEVVAISLYQAIFTAGSLWRHFAIMSIWTVILILSSTLASPRRGASGLALSYLVAWFVSFTLYALVAQRLDVRQWRRA